MSAPTAGEAPGQTRRRWWWAGGVIALLAVVFSVAALSRPKAPAVQTAEVRRGSLLVPVQCDGTLEPPPGGELRASDSGAVAELLASSGDRVRAGTPLLRLANDELSKEALDARSEVLRLESERSAATSDAAELERQEQHAARVFEADKRLLASGAITRMTYEQDELAWQQARDKLRAARARLAALEGAQDGEGSRIALARKSADELERRVSAMTVRAPSDGLVYGLPRRVGEAVSAGQVVANVIDPAHRRLRARVDQPDLPQTAVGQRLVVKFDGLPRERWEGTVTFVDPGLRDVGGREVGEVLGEVADPRAQLPSNAAVEVEIVTGEKTGALVVPRASLIRDGEKRYVYVLDRGKARRREVEVGLLGLTEAEILSGVGEKDTVILPGSVSLSDGLRVRSAGPKA
ncbi:MAG TPA: efflux RND transporter periplasmic adaptor subunit [Thermoanaerobaculia bacterium]|nr:efflux RND transporter periplasmic adaptor subunit [Thermoanaerobaculia bacterium]